MQKKPIYKSLYFQVIVAIILGVLLGHFSRSVVNLETGVVEYVGYGQAMEPLATGFIKLIKMVVAPIIFCTVVSGIAGMESMKSVGKTGGIALLYFEVVSTIALIIGLIVVNVIKPGVGATTNITKAAMTAAQGYQAKEPISTVQFLLDIIPDTVVGAFANGQILQVLFFAVFFGFALHRLGESGRLLLNIIDQFAHSMFNIVNIIMKLAPIGAFGAMAFTIGRYGIETLVQLGWLMGCFYATCLIFIFGVLGTIAHWNGFTIMKLIRFIREELLIVLGTSSSESVLPRMLKKMELAGCHKSVVGLVIPTGYSFNLDGTSIYLTMAAIFIAQATHTELTLTHQITLLLVLLVSSKGAAAVTGGGFIVLAATLQTVGHIPTYGLAMIFGIDRFMSEARALTNLIGNTLATIVVARYCGQLDSEKLNYALSNPAEIDQRMVAPAR